MKPTDSSTTSLFARAAIATLLAAPVVAGAAPSAKLSASRTSGPAPLAVFFDATGTTDSAADPIRQIGYRFTFGDAQSGTWQYSNRSRNEQIGGPLAAHVFEQPGTYTVQVTAKDAAGATSVASVTVTVESADATFSGTRTVCMSRSGDFAGCPSGAQQIANASQWPTFQSGYRYLLHRGQDFTALNSLRFGNGSNGIVDAQLAAFGSGAKPLIGNLTLVSGRTPDTTWHKRIVVMDLDVQNIAQDIAGIDVLLLRNSVTRGGMIDIAGAFGYYVLNSTATGWHDPQNIFVVDNVVDRNFGGSDGNPMGIAGNATRFAIMGNSVDRTYEHNIRIWQGNKVVVANNRLSGRAASAIRHALKIHSAGTDQVLSSFTGGTLPSSRSSYVQITDNKIGSTESNINWLAASSPQNGESAEGLEYVIWEDNDFAYGTNYATDIAWAGRNMIGRGNRNITANRGATYAVGHTEALPSDWRGPYYSSDASMKLRFSGSTTVVPRSPANLVVE